MKFDEPLRSSDLLVNFQRKLLNVDQVVREEAKDEVFFDQSLEE